LIDINIELTNRIQTTNSDQIQKKK
jgi:hypothetical protein